MSAHRTITYHRDRRMGSCVEQPRPSRMADCDAVEYVLRFPTGQILREWKFEREGWVFGAGMLMHPADGPAVEALGRAALATWKWLPGTASSIIPPRPTRDITEVSASVLIKCQAADLWSLIRSVEHSSLLDDTVVEAFKVPGTPDGVGEQQVVVLQDSQQRLTVITEIVEEKPHERIVTTDLMMDDLPNRTTYLLTPGAQGTVLEITMRYSVEPERATRQADSYMTAIQTYTARAKQLLEDGWLEVHPGSSA